VSASSAVNAFTSFSKKRGRLTATTFRKGFEICQGVGDLAMVHCLDTSEGRVANEVPMQNHSGNSFAMAAFIEDRR
jgi:dihydroorotase-like cyclic amidohydrolase